MHFEFSTATRILFGAGRLLEGLLELPGTRAFMVTGSRHDRCSSLFEGLNARGIVWQSIAVRAEPTLSEAAHAIVQARAFQGDMVIAMGGGSVLDMGKAIAAMLTNEGELLDYVEIVGRGCELQHRSAYFVAIPTTAGTGSEVTRNAVLAVPEQRVKVSLRSRLMLPHLAIVDPELTLSMPPEVTASTGLDALTQCIEAFVSHAANPLTDAICREGISRSRGLVRAFHQGDDRSARHDMCVTSLCGGLALANAKLGAVHGFAAVLGGMFSAPHGVICARLLGPVMAATIAAARGRLRDTPILSRFDDVARLLSGNHDASASDGVRIVEDLRREMKIPSLGALGLEREAVPLVVEKAKNASSMKGHPLTLTTGELAAILEQSYD